MGLLDGIKCPAEHSVVKDMNLQQLGRDEITLAESEMPGLMELRRLCETGSSCGDIGLDEIQRLMASSPNGKLLQDIRITGCLHMTTQTAVLIETFAMMGATVRWASCNIFSTQDSAAAAVVGQNPNVCIFAWKGETIPEYWECVEQALTFPQHLGPQLIIDDGADAVALIHRGHEFESSGTLTGESPDDVALNALLSKRHQTQPHKWTDMLAKVLGVAEETTTGVARLNRLAAAGKLLFPAISVNSSVTKSKFDNIYGCRHSLLDGIYRATDILLAGKTALVVGFGDVGKGCAEALKAAGCIVCVSEIDPICALQACMNGYRVMTIEQALPEVDVLITATGCCNVVVKDHLTHMKDAAIVGNIGHFDNEIALKELRRDASIKCKKIKPQVEVFTFPNGKRIILLAEGRLLNLGCATGHPSFVMSCSFTNQVIAALALLSRSKEGEAIPISVTDLPTKCDEYIAKLHLRALGGTLSILTNEQAEYLGIPVEGPFKGPKYRY